MIITVSGVDCAGKSTQIELLRQHFISLGKTCHVLWYRPGYSKQLQTVKNLVRPILKAAKQIRPSAPSARPADTNRVHAPGPLWLATAILDMTVQYAVMLRALQKKYDVIICDRYVHDAIFDLTFKFPHFQFSGDILTTLAHTFPKTDFNLLLWLPYDKVLERLALKDEPFPDPPDVRKARWHAYQFLLDEDDITSIDASGTIEDVHKQILSVIGC